MKASLLPSLATLAGQGDLVGFRNMQLKIVAAVAALALATTAAAAAVGAPIVRFVFGDELGRSDMTLLAASGGGLMLMLSLALGLVALGHNPAGGGGMDRRDRRLRSRGELPPRAVLRVELALLAAVLAGSLVAGVLLRLAYAAHTQQA